MSITELVKQQQVSVLTIDRNNRTVFGSIQFAQFELNNRLLTDRITTSSLRFRQSASSYQSDFHVAGDPTLIVILQGALQIALQSGATATFQQGECFIAADFLPKGVAFNANEHGHSAKVVGGDDFKAIHIKLESKYQSIIYQQVNV